MSSKEEKEGQTSTPGIPDSSNLVVTVSESSRRVTRAGFPSREDTKVGVPSRVWCENTVIAVGNHTFELITVFGLNRTEVVKIAKASYPGLLIKGSVTATSIAGLDLVYFKVDHDSVTSLINWNSFQSLVNLQWTVGSFEH